MYDDRDITGGRKELPGTFEDSKYEAEGINNIGQGRRSLGYCVLCCVV